MIYKKIKVNHWSEIPQTGSFEVEFPNRDRSFFTDGEWNRSASVTIICKDGASRWSLNGIEYTKAEWEIERTKYIIKDKII